MFINKIIKIFMVSLAIFQAISSIELDELEKLIEHLKNNPDLKVGFLSPSNYGKIFTWALKFRTLEINFFI